MRMINGSGTATRDGRSLTAVFALAGLLAATSLAGSPATAAELAANSRITAVTVYPRGAEVSRTVTVAVPAGESTLIFRGLPSDIQPETIRVEGESTTTVTIGSVETQRQNLTRDERDAVAAERKALEDQIAEAENTLEKIGYDIKAKETQRAFLENLATLPARPGPAPSMTGQAGSTDWAALFDLIGRNMATVQGDLFQLARDREEQEEVIADLRRQLQRLASAPRRALVGRVAITSDAAGEATLTLRYAVRNASWTPHYDARLTTAIEDGKSAVTLTRRAAIQQSTSEAWTDVNLTLSTVRPGGRTAAPDVRPVAVDFAPPPPTEKVAAEALDESRGRQAAARQTRSGGIAGVMSMAAPRPVAQAGADVSAGAFQATYTISGATTVPNNGAVRQLKIDQTTVVPELKVVSVPRVDPRAYLYAAFDLPAGTPYLPGIVSLFRDNTYVGRGRLPGLPGGEKLELGFGADDLVKVKFAAVDETRGETGIISSSKTDQRGFKIELVNQHTTPIRYTVLDRLPVARNEDITVERNGRTRPSRTNVDDKPGVVAWDGELKPQANTEIAFGYLITWPADKQIRYR